MATQAATANRPKQDSAPERQLQKLREIYADAPGQGSVVWQMGSRARDAAQEVDDLFREILPDVARKRLTPRRVAKVARRV